MRNDSKFQKRRQKRLIKKENRRKQERRIVSSIDNSLDYQKRKLVIRLREMKRQFALYLSTTYREETQETDEFKKTANRFLDVMKQVKSFLEGEKNDKKNNK